MAAPGSILLVVVFASMLAFSYQLQCYECTEGGPTSSRSLADSCGNFSDSLLTNCSSTVEICTKIDTTMNDTTVSIHACGTTKDACDKVSDADTPEGLEIDCYSCDSDGCNGASSAVAAVSILAFSLFFAKLC